MVTVALALFGIANQAPVPTVFSPEGLGKAAYAAFSQPEIVTIRSVYPAIRGERVERMFGAMPLRFAAPTRNIPKRFVKDLIENFSHPYRPLEKQCVFHPDHLVTFTRGKHTVEAISCFTCDELMVVADGKYIDRVSMGPPKKLRTIFTSSVPLTDTMRAASEEWLTRELVQAFGSAPGGRIFKSTYSASAFPKTIIQDPGNASRALSRGDLQILFDILEAHCMNNRLSFQFAQPPLTSIKPPQATVVLRSNPAASLVFYAAYSRAELYLAGKRIRTIDLYGIEDRLQSFLAPKMRS